MHFCTSILLLAVLPILIASPLPAQDNSIPGVNVINPFQANSIPDQYIIVYKKSASDDEVKAHQDGSQKKLDALPGKNGLQLKGIKRVIKINDFRAMIVEATATGMRRIASDKKLISFVEIDTMHSITVPTGSNITQISPFQKRELIEQPGGSHPWNLARISHSSGKQTFAPYTYDSTACQGTRIYVLDTGIQTTHKEFGFPSRADWGANFIDGSPNTDQNGHGTFCAGIIAGIESGVCKKATVVAVKVLDSAGSGSSSGILSGVQWAFNHAAALKMRSKSVIFVSASISVSASLDAIVTAAYYYGVMTVVAAGSDGVDASTRSPGRASIVMTVGASSLIDQRPPWSNYGGVVDIHAPGVTILSSWIGKTDNWYNVLSGTPIAAAHVAAMSAYYIAKEGWNTPALITQRLIDSAVKSKIYDPDGRLYNFQNLLLNNGNGL